MTLPSDDRLEELIKAQAYGLGFDLVGITSVGPAETSDRFDQWIERGFEGDMTYLSRGAEKRQDTSRPFPPATHAIVVVMNYGGREPSGPVARYARGDDYHDVMMGKLDTLRAWIESVVGRPIAAKPYVDTGPILERDLARKAGVGWIAKNTNLIHPALGSFFLLGTLLIDLELAVDAPFEADRCGSCTRCIDACPTDAIVAPHVLDATRCISYLTIENRGAIAEELRPLVGELLYGCDICQDVCPWNVRFSQPVREPAFAPRAAIADKDGPTLARDILAMTPTQFAESFKGSPMKRAKLRGLKRNAAIVLGNAGAPEDVALLTSVLDDPEPLISTHAAWALGKLSNRQP